MIRPSAAALICVALLGASALAGCSSDARLPEGMPSFYRDLATSDAVLDAMAAQSMISGYRAMCGRLRVGKGFLHKCSIGRSGHVFGLLMRFT